MERRGKKAGDENDRRGVRRLPSPRPALPFSLSEPWACFGSFGSERLVDQISVDFADRHIAAAFRSLVSNA
jgi:hypothetical protein